jgi:hypothetical protein
MVSDENDIDLVGMEEVPGGEHFPGSHEVKLFGSVKEGDGDPDH